MIQFPTLVEILAIHRRLIERYGGADGVRDYGLIEAALFRPQTGYYDDLIKQAAALWESLSQNHPFIDGNKRVSLATTDIFLRMNGAKIVATPEAACQHILALYEKHQFNFAELEVWLRANVEQE